MSAAEVIPLVQPDDLDIGKMELAVVNRKLRSLDTRIEQAITDGTLERTLEGASTLTLTLNDPRRALLQSGIFSRQVDIRLDTFTFRLVKVTKSADDLTLTFEDKQVALLRGPERTKKANRKNVTRAQFALSLIREVRPHIAYRIPELKQKQPTATPAKGSRSQVRKAMPYQFRRGGTDGTKEDSWTALQRLAQEVGWRCFCSSGVVWFVSENWLLAQKAIFAWSEQTLGISSIDFDIDNGKANSDMTVVARAGRWAAGPGAPVQIDGQGPANGIWLVSRVTRGLFSAEATITLKRPTKKLLEPAPEMNTISSAKGTLSAGGKGGKSAGKSASKADDVYAAAVAIDAKHYPYVWGGGHGGAGIPSGGGYDCSGGTCAVLAAGGLGFHHGGPVMTSGTLASRWGAPGEGRLFTVWANSIHVFIIFNTTQGKRHFGTGRWGKSFGGPGFGTMHPTGGFTPRHWPGL